MRISELFSLKQVLNEMYNSGEMHCLTQKETEQIQQVLLKMYRDIVNACEKYNIKPILQGGTLLGKIRHDGFIPWDDDLDIGMSRKDYENFKHIYQKELSDRYILTAPNSPYPAAARFIQIFKRDTFYETFAHRKNVPKNLYIDIFPIDYVPDSKLVRVAKGYFSNMVMFLAGCLEYKQNLEPHIKKLGDANAIAKINYSIRSILGTAVSFWSLPKWYDAVDSAIRCQKKGRLCTSGTGRKHYLGECVPAEVFFPLRETNFCGVRAWMPQCPETYLINLYGKSYMKVPPSEKREHHFVKGIKI